MKYVLLILLLTVPTACAAKAEILQANFDEIADKCGLPRSTLQLRGRDELLIQPAQDAKFEAIDCALKELKAANYPVKMGFVGNEIYQEEAK